MAARHFGPQSLLPRMTIRLLLICRRLLLRAGLVGNGSCSCHPPASAGRPAEPPAAL